MNVLLYPYHPVSGRAGLPQEAEIDSLTSEPVLLAFMTFEQPPAVAARQVAVFHDELGHVPLDPTTGKWKVVADWVGHRYWLADGSMHQITEEGVSPPVGALDEPPVSALTAADYAQAIQAHLDAAARGRGYDSIATVVTYAEEPAVKRFQDDGRAFRAWRSLVWAYAYEQLDLVTAGKRAQPTVDALVAELPVLVLK